MKSLLVALAVVVVAFQGWAAEVPVQYFTPETMTVFQAAQVGESFVLDMPAGDGCNTCKERFLKVSDTAVQASGSLSCTLRACMRPEPIREVRPAPVPVEPTKRA